MSKITNKFNLPEPIYRALTEDKYSRGESNRSITQLIDAPRQRIMMSENTDVVEYDASEMLWMVLGTAVHDMFEQHAVAAHLISEERLSAEMEGWEISGAIDLQVELEDRSLLIQDYKCTSVWSVIYDKIEWHNQLNAYAWLVEQNKPAVVNRLEVVAVLRDWKQREAQKDSNYPQAPIVIVDIPLWSQKEQDIYIRTRVKLHQDAEFMRLTGQRLPDCTDQERWVKPTTYAVMKNKNKRALRVLNGLKEANQYILDWQAKNEGSKDKLSIVKRPGEATRCKDWCRVSHLCEQYQEELNVLNQQ